MNEHDQNEMVLNRVNRGIGSLAGMRTLLAPIKKEHIQLGQK